MYELSSSLSKIARGTGIAFIGTFLGLLLGFVSRPIIARHGSEADYGVFSLALVVITIVTLISCLGLQEGATRFIAYFRGKDEPAKVRGTITVSLQITAIASIILAISLFLGSEAIALGIFHTPELTNALRIFAVGLPFLVMVNMLAAVFRGFDRMEPQAYFQYILLNASFLLFLIAGILLGLPFIAVFYAYLAATITTLVALSFYAAKRLPRLMALPEEQTGGFAKKELFSFSLPLLGTAMLSVIILWMDTLMLGYFKTPDVVGLYNAARPLAQFISEPLAAMLLVYTPVATVLYAQNAVNELKRNYTIVTKWIVSLTLPFFLVLFLFPEAVLNLFFGPTYVAAAPALRILSLGFIVNNLFGPNQSVLLAAGHSRFVMWSVAVTAMLNIVLGILLIPPWGIIGAAVASIVSLISTRIIIAVRIYQMFGAHPWSKNLLNPVIASALLAFLFWFATRGLVAISWWMLPLLFVLYCVIYGLAMVFTRSFDKEDIALLLEIEGRSGINTAPVKRILGKFIR